MKRALQGVVIGAASFVIALMLDTIGVLERPEAQTWDWRVRRHQGDGTATDQILCIFLDEASLQWAEGKDVGVTWPWPRDAYVGILNFCRRGGARAVAFDILFPTPSEHRYQDDAFASAIGETPGFVLAARVGGTDGVTSTWPAGLAGDPVACISGLPILMTTPLGSALAEPSGTFPIPGLATNAAAIGNVAGRADSDAVVRRASPFSTFDGRFLPSLALATYKAAHPEAEIKVRGRTLQVGASRLPLAPDGSVVLRFRGASQAHETVSAAAVIQSEQRLQEGLEPVLDPGVCKDRYVFFANTGDGILDVCHTPVSGEDVYPGVEIHATLLDNILSDDAIGAAPAYAGWLFALVLGLVGGAGTRCCGRGWHMAVLAVVCVPTPWIVGDLLYGPGTWFPVVMPAVATTTSILGGIIWNYAAEGRQKRFIKQAFKRYLSPAVIDRLIQDPGRLQLGGELRELSIFFSDVQGFTGISEKLTPAALTALLNEYLTAMTTIIHEEGGTIDKYEGDAIIAFWNAPLAVPDHAQRSVRAAQRCQERLAEIRGDLCDRYGCELYARIGINSGPVVVGNMGSHQRFDYSFLGDAGNLAARLEGINKQFHTHILISEQTAGELNDSIPLREISRVRVVGRSEPVRVFGLAVDPGKAAEHASFAESLAHYYAGRFVQAAAGFHALADCDPVAAVYVERCRELAESPPEPWDGVWSMTSK